MTTKVIADNSEVLKTVVTTLATLDHSDVKMSDWYSEAQMTTQKVGGLLRSTDDNQDDSWQLRSSEDSICRQRRWLTRLNNCKGNVDRKWSEALLTTLNAVDCFEALNDNDGWQHWITEDDVDTDDSDSTWQRITLSTIDNYEILLTAT